MKEKNIEQGNRVEMQISPFFSGCVEIGSFAVKMELDQNKKKITFREVSHLMLLKMEWRKDGTRISLRYVSATYSK